MRSLYTITTYFATPHIASIYRIFIREGLIELHFNDEVLTTGAS